MILAHKIIRTLRYPTQLASLRTAKTDTHCLHSSLIKPLLTSLNSKKSHALRTKRSLYFARRNIATTGKIQGSLHCGAKSAPSVEMTVLQGIQKENSNTKTAAKQP